jgi:hypothetical protein
VEGPAEQSERRQPAGHAGTDPDVEGPAEQSERRQPAGHAGTDPDVLRSASPRLASSVRLTAATPSRRLATVSLV